MILTAIKHYVQAIVSGAILLAALVLLVLQWGNKAELTAYGPKKDINTLLLMLACAVGGVVAWWLFKVLWRSTLAIHKLRQSSVPPQSEEPPGEA